MFPYRDDNPTSIFPVVTLAIVGVTVAVWVLVQGAGFEPALSRSICALGAIPASVLGDGVSTPVNPRMVCQLGSGGGWITVLTSIFLHGGWFHLIGNLWFLWVFGDNIEESMGHLRFVVFYLVCGVGAALAQMMVNPASPIPMVGASGAISGVMGAYLVLFPRVKVHTLIFLGFFVTTLTLPAYFMLLYWVGLQLLGSLPALAGGSTGGGVAFLAHLGGFVLGAVSIKFFAKSSPQKVGVRDGRPEIGVWR